MRLAIAILLAISCQSPAFAASTRGGSVAITQALALVYARNSSDAVVTLHVDGDYQGQVDPHSWSTLGVTYGEHTFSWTDGTYSSSMRYNVRSSPFNWPVGR